MIDLSAVELTSNQCFITSIYDLDLSSAGLHDELLQHVLAVRSAGEKGIDYEGAGWQTPHDLHRRPAFAPFFEVVHRILAEIAKAEGIPAGHEPVVHSAWSNVQGRGEFVRTHMHPWSAFSGVFYASVDDEAGDLYFEDPRPAHKSLLFPSIGRENRALVRFHPRPGLMVVFPSWLEHYTDPSRSDALRVCLSFNATLGSAKAVPDLGI